MSISAEIRATDRIAFVARVSDEVALRGREPDPSDRHVVYPVRALRAPAAGAGPAVHGPGRTHPAGVRRLRPPRLRRGEPAHRPAARLRLPDHDAAGAAAEPARAAAEPRRRLGGPLSAGHRDDRPAGRCRWSRRGAGTPASRRSGTAARSRPALAVTIGTLSSPRTDDDNGGKQISGRVGVTPTASFSVGVSARERRVRLGPGRPHRLRQRRLAARAGAIRRPIASRRSASTPSTRSATSWCAARWWRAAGTCRSRTASRRWRSTPWAARSRRGSR